MKFKFITTLMAAVVTNGVQATNDFDQTRGGIATVGTDNDCDFRVGTSKIQDALDSANNYTEIRITNDQTYLENIRITNRNITIKGGYANCSDASNGIQNSNSRSTIKGTLARAVIIIEADDLLNRNIVTLENLELTDGRSTPGEIEVGGIGSFNASLDLFLNRVDISSNQSSFVGGGINFFNDSLTRTTLTATDVIIQNNEGSRGGGIFCSGISNEISIEGASSISFNSADNGGGLYLENGCELNMYSGQENGNAATIFNGIVLNEAVDNGGGLYLSSGAAAYFNSNKRCTNFAFETCLTFIGSQSTTVNISSNQAGQNGGGIYITGMDTTAELDTTLVNLNTANIAGGGAYVTDQGRFAMFWQADDADNLYRTCANPGSCSELSGNDAGFFGGALYVSSQAEATLLRTYVKNNFNSNGGSTGSVAYVTGEDATLAIDGSVISNNGDNNDGFTFRTFNGVNSTIALTIENSTVADNQASNEIFGNSDSAINISGSIISEPSASAIYIGQGNDSNAAFNCLIVSEDTSLQDAAGFNSVFVDDPEFIDRANGNYRIDATASPAVDLCAAIDSSDTLDIDLQNRGFDDSSVSNQNGTFDAGADETYDSDIIFEDGFESQL